MSEQTGGTSRTLLLRLAGPLQSWGISGQFIERDTAAYPSKSGVIGLLAGALGRKRGEDIADLIELSFGVRVDRPGALVRDFHTISHHDGSGLRTANGTLLPPEKSTKVTNRYYLSDAVFVAGLTGSDELLDALDSALRHPVYAPFLGRKSCPPAAPIDMGIHSGDLMHALSSVAWQGGVPGATESPTGKLHLIVEDPRGIDLISDVPVSFDPVRRGFSSRRTSHFHITVVDPESALVPDFHDPFSLIGW